MLSASVGRVAPAPGPFGLGLPLRFRGRPPAPVRRWQAGRVRLFVAILPPGVVLDQVAALRRPERSGVRWTTRV